MGLNTSDSKSKKEIRRRLNKELKDDGFGDDIFDFLDQLDHVMEAPDMNKIKKELSQDEIDSLEKSRKKKAKKNAKVDLKQAEEGGDEEEEEELEGMSEDDGLDEDLSDGIVDADYLRSYAKDNGLRVMNEEEEEEEEMEEEEEEEEEASANDADLLESEEGEEEQEEQEEEEEEKEEEEKEEESEKEENESKPAASDEPKDVRYEDITDIYGRVKAGHEEDLKRFTAKYVPPHLRNQSSTSDDSTQFDQAIIKQIREIVNKVTDDTFISMCHLLIAAYTKYPKNSVRSNLYTTIIAATKNQFKIIHHYIRLYAGLIAAAQHESDMNVVSFITENVVNVFEAECENAINEHDTSVRGSRCTEQ